MLVVKIPKIVFGPAIGLLLLLLVFSIFPRQGTPPSPTPSPSPSPSPAVTPKPVASATPTPLPGAQNFHKWGSITLFNGLPSDSVRAIAQTPDGVMWFGTDNGLARFDGRRVQNYTFGDGDANRVLALRTTSTGQLWVGTQKGAFVYTDNHLVPIEGTAGVGITAILFADENFLATDSGLVLRAKAGEGGVLAAEKLFPDPVVNADGNPLGITSLIKAGDKLLAATAGRGVLSVREGGYAEFQTSPRPLFVNSLAVSANGALWFGTDAAKGLSGIYSVEGSMQARRIAAPTANVLALDADESGVSAGSERYGLFRFDESRTVKPYTFENTLGGLRSDTIFTIFTDRESVVWIGTNRGVSRYDPTAPFQQTISDIPNSNFVRTFYNLSNKRAYVGTNRGLFYSDDRLTWTEIAGLRNKAVYAIADRPEGPMIVGTADGLYDLSGKKLMDGDVRGFANSDQRQYAAVFGRGVVDITGDRPQTVFADETVTSVKNLSNKLWIGTAGHGLFSLSGQTAKIEAGPEVLKSGAIWNIFDTPGGIIYIAGQHGVFTFGAGEVKKIIEAEDVRDVFERDGHVWAATTTRGLLHARYDAHFGWLVSSIGFEQGLPSEKAFLIRPLGDALAIATNRGLVTYYPHNVIPKLIPIRVLSQRMHDPGELNSAIALEYPQNSLLVEVGGLSSRTFPEEFQYSFLLKDARGEVVDSRLSGDPQYAPTDLRPGDYSIVSVAYDRDLLASEPLTISFSIARAPFPWTATGLGILLFIALVALVWAVMERRQIVLRNQELAAARLDLANEAERERRRIARDLHDQTLADLRNLMMMSDQIAPDNQRFRSEVEAVSVEIRRICEDLSPSVLENVGLVAALEFLLSNTIADHHFSAADTTEDRLKFPLNVKLQVYRIAQEVLTNIKRHSTASRVEMSVAASSDGAFVMTIADDGEAFAPAEITAAGRGISNIRSRASLIGADISWRQSSGGDDRGTTFSLQKSVG